MQTQLFLHQQRTDQTTPLISGTLLGPQHETDVAPFAEFVQQLPDASAPDLVEITTTSEGQAAAQNEQGIDETGLLMAESEDRNRTAHLAIAGGEKTVLTTDHQGTSVSSQLLEVRIGQNAQVDDPTTAGKFFDQDPLLSFTKHDAEQQENDPKSTARDLQSPVTMAAITTQENRGDLNGSTTLLSTFSTQGQASKQPDFVTAPNPVELALLSQELHVESDEKGRPGKAVRSDQSSDSVALQREPLYHYLQFTKPSDAINSLTLPVPAKPLTLSTRAEHLQLISKSDVTDQYSTSETVKLAHYAINVTPAAALNDGKKPDPNVLLDHTRDVFELRTNTLIETRSTTYVPPSHTVNRSDFASPVTRQIVDAIQARVTADKVIEVSLNPAELGRLKLSLTPAENGMVINVMAERTETIEMIRRNLTDLEQAFLDMGHENITFSFDQSGDFGKHAEQQHSKFHSDGIDGPDHVASNSGPFIQDPRDQIITSGIDIRV